MELFRVRMSGFVDLKDQLLKTLIETVPLYRGSWQSRDVSGSANHATHEIQGGVVISYQMPGTVEHAQNYIQPDLPWAEDHFQERVSGKPLNPPPSQEYWPHHNGGKGQHQNIENDQFDHTYPERFWPKGNLYVVKDLPNGEFYFGDGEIRDGLTGEIVPNDQYTKEHRPRKGIRFDYGDLWDVVKLLGDDPMTRQAYLPIWFPEDTGAHKEDRHIRVPCTLGYHFIRRGVSLDLHYFMRSCDIVRHFSNDVYMAVRLAQWVRDRISDEVPELATFVGSLNMHISNLHLMVGDVKVVLDERS